MKNLPKICPGVTKYGDKGLYNADSFNHIEIPQNLKKVLVKSANNSLACKTWGTYKSSLNMLNICAEELNVSLAFPLKEGKILSFVAWCINKGNSADTIKSYLAGLTQAHLALGLKAPNFYTKLVSQVLKGQNNVYAKNKNKQIRLPCTLTVLRLLKAVLAKAPIKTDEKIVIWAACCIAFYGAFRMSELLCKKSSSYDPEYTLLKRDVKVKNSGEKSSIQFKIKSAKSNKTGKPEIVEVFSTNTLLCPVKAMKKLATVTAHLPKGAPVFCDSNGKALTSSRLNRCLNYYLNSHFKQGKISGHSFRAGLISMFARLGYDSFQLKQIGRWSSRAYERYIKLNQTKRFQMANIVAYVK